MARNGTGTYSLLTNSWNPAVNGVTATAADWQALINDVAAALTQSVSADGQTPMTGNLPMGNNRITGLANGVALTDAATLAQTAKYVGNCRLTKSGANLLLIPYQGNQLTINGILQTVPSAGVTLAPTGTAGTLYYIYAYMVTTVMTLEASTTGHSTDTTTGVEIKTGDSSRTLVGMARPVTGPAWQDVVNQRFVVTWFNRRPLQCQAALAADTATTSTIATGVELSTTLRNEFLAWNGDAIGFSTDGFVNNTGAGNTCRTTIWVDATVKDSYSVFQSVNAGSIGPHCATLQDTIAADGYHYTTLAASVNAGTGTWNGSVSTGLRSTLKGSIQG